MAKLCVVDHTEDYTLQSVESGSIHTNNGASSTVILTLPSDPSNGDFFIFINFITVTDSFQLFPGPSHFIKAHGVVSWDAGGRSNGVRGSKLTLIFDGIDSWYQKHRILNWVQL